MSVVEAQPTQLPAGALQFEPMVALRPPAAQYDDGMHRVYEEVEKALREAGHLR